MLKNTVLRSYLAKLSFLLVIAAVLAVDIQDFDSITADLVSDNESVPWWEMEQLDEKLFEPFRTSKIFMRSVDLDDSKIHSCYEYKVISALGVTTHADTFCFPSIIITGYRKSSTSALYNLFAQYPNAKLSPMKENCAFIGDRSIVQYFDSLPRTVERGELLFDGCVDLKGNIKLRKLLRQPNAYYVVLVRDYASWVWSAYNYWCQPEYDSGCSIYDHWVDADRHLRSPELFHDIVQGSINGTAVASPLLFKHPCDEGASIFRRFVTSLWSAVPPRNTMVLASEDLEADPHNVWLRIARVVGLHEAHPKLKEFAEVRYNTQLRGAKGENAAVSADQVRPGLYAVSKFRPMLDSTRSALNSCWRDDCLWASLVTGHRYAACIQRNDSSRSVAVIAASHLQGNMSIDATTVHYTQLMTVVDERKAFLKLPQIVCEANFNSTVVTAKQQDGVGGLMTDGPATARALSGDVIRHITNNHNRVRKSASSLRPRGVLLLSPLRSNRDFVRSLIHFAAAGGAGLTMVEVGDTGLVEAHSGASGDVCSALKIAVKSGVDGAEHRLLVSTNPRNVRVAKRESGEVEVVFRDGLALSCGADSLPTSYTSVVYVIRDSLTAVWTQYQRNHGYNVGHLHKDEAAMVHFNWTQWEHAAVDMLLNSTAIMSTGGGTAEDSAFQHAIIQDVRPRHKLILRIEDVMFGAAKISLLQVVIAFVRGAGSHPESNTAVSRLYGNVSSTSMKCTHLLATNQVPRSKDSFVSRANIELAYASDELLCRVTKLYEHNPLQLLSLQRAAHNTTCVNGVDVSRNIARKCKLRYAKRTYLATARFPAVLLATPGTEAINTRLLIEHATGIYSGAMDTNRFLVDLFPAEIYCGQRMSVVHASPHDVTIRFAKTGIATVSLTNLGKKKCMRGTIRGFSQALLLTRDPFASVWREYEKTRNVSLSIETTALSVTLEADLLGLAATYSAEKLEVSHAYERLHHFNFVVEKVLIVSYESLLYRGNGTGSTADVFASQPRHAVATELLAFAHFEAVYPERLECAFRFMEAAAAEQAVRAMTAFLSPRPQLVCAMNKLFEKALEPNRFKFIRLFNDVKC